MNIGFKKGYAELADEILAKIEATRKDTTDGKVVFEGGLGFISYTDLLFSILRIPEEVPEAEVLHAASRAVFAAANRGLLTRSTFRKHVNRELSEYGRSAEQRYVLATSISIKSSNKLSRIRLGNTYIIFEPALPERYQREAAQLYERLSHSFPGDAPSDYQSVRVHVNARSVNDAAATAFFHLDFIRGTWNWLAQYGRHEWRFGPGMPKPINKFVLAPIQTVHFTSGELATKDQWYYQPTYLAPVRPYDFESEDGERLINAFNDVRQALKHHPYKADVQRALVEYGRALDETRDEIAFVQLWTVFEFLTAVSSGQGGHSYDDAIKRATFFLKKDRDYHKSVLSRVRDYRNDLIHRNDRGLVRRSLLMLLKSYVDILIMFHLRNPGECSTLQEAAEVCDFPPEPAELENCRREILNARDEIEKRESMLEKAQKTLMTG